MPGDGIAAADEGFLLLGDQLVLGPEHGEGMPGGLAERLGLVRPEDAEQVHQAGAAVLGGGLDVLGGDPGIVQPPDRSPGPPSLEQFPPAAEQEGQPQDEQDGASGLGQPASPGGHGRGERLRRTPGRLPDLGGRPGRESREGLTR